MSKLTQKRLIEVLNYEPSTGKWIWRKRLCSRTVVGSEAGRIANGRRSIQIDGERFYAYRLAVLYMSGRWPAIDVDHENLKKDDDRWDNLREATKSQNNANARARSTNKCGLKGVSRTRNGQRFAAFVQVSGKTKYLGTFDCPAVASFAYQIEANAVYGEFARAA